ncbi:LANO_0D06920g1_1 [Lachancea nothofagi CBS 11611]|uniref:LANO_0D06920g1_1 n=1 Tax=Lachancea nothofagi CBS 11611 TaxID=1266666 RepID=A0A1G4JI10_9SACH|nr:LANO_0D06920g1_1 [Lachancea nothofagi CBS 11611]
MSDRDAYLYQKSIPAPKLAQAEFPEVGAKENTENGKLFASTPPKLTIQQFMGGDMSMLPTPLVYTPSSPNMATRSPVESSFPGAPTSARSKKDYGMLNSPTAEMFNRSHILEDKQRILSEYAPHSALAPATASSLSQRIASLPGEDRKLDTLEEVLESTANETYTPESLSPGTDGVLTAYAIKDSSKALKLRKMEQIGVGNFSDVYLYEPVDLNETSVSKVAVKCVKYPEALTLSSSPKSPRYREVLSRVERSLTREIEALVGISHPCIIELLAINDLTFVNSKRPLSSRDLTHGLPPCEMVMSYCAGGDLFELASQNVLPKWLLRRIFTELVLAIKYLHENLIVHRDLKLENVLIKYPLETLLEMHESEKSLASHHIVELADFGLCRRIEPEEMCTTRCGSEDYVSPEILMGVPYDGRLSDTWALGVILYALLEERLPFDPLPTAVPGKRQRRSSVAHRISRFEWRWLKLADSDSPAKQIVASCLNRKNQRFDIQKIYENPYVHEIVPTLKFIQ